MEARQYDETMSKALWYPGERCFAGAILTGGDTVTIDGDTRVIVQANTHFPYQADLDGIAWARNNLGPLADALETVLQGAVFATTADDYKSRVIAQPGAEVAALTARRDDLLALLDECRSVRAALIAEVGTLRSALAAMTAERDQLIDLKRKLATHLDGPDFSRAIAGDIRLGRTSAQIRDEIIAKVGMMAEARTPEMQARYDTAVARESAPKSTDPMLSVTIGGSRTHEAVMILARAVLELLQEAGISCAMPEETENPYDGDSIEQLGYLRNVDHVVVQTSTFKEI